MPVTWRPNANAKARPIPSQNNGNQAGGGTVHYGAVSWRFHEDDFRVRSQTIERYGAAALPEGSSIIDWPLSYADLEPYYERAEYELGVSGKAGNLAGQEDRRRQCVRGAAQSANIRCRRCIMDQVGANFDPAARKLGLHPFSTPHAILSEPYKDRPGCTYCGFCQAFGCHVGAKSSILVTKLPEADATGNFKLITGALCHHVNSDNSGKVTGVSYYGPDRSDNTIEADIVILAPFIYDNVRLLLLSKSEKFPNGLANSSGHVGKHIMAHIGARAFAAFDDRHVNVYMGPSAQKNSLDDFNADNFDHKDLGFIRGAQISAGPAGLEGGPLGTAMSMNPPPGVPRWGAAYRDFIAKYYTRYTALTGQTENLPYADQTIDLDPNVRDAWGLPAPRMTYDWRRPTERARIEFIQKKMVEIGQAMGAAHVWTAPFSPGSPGGAPPGRHPHGQQSAGIGRQQIQPKLGCPEPVHHGQFDSSHHERLQSDVDDSGAGLHDVGRHRESLSEKSGIAAVTSLPTAFRSGRDAGLPLLRERRPPSYCGIVPSLGRSQFRDWTTFSRFSSM